MPDLYIHRERRNIDPYTNTQTWLHMYNTLKKMKNWKHEMLFIHSHYQSEILREKKTFKIVWFAWLLINKKWKSIVSFIENSIQFILNSLKRIWREKKRQISFLFSSQFELIISIIICEFIFGLFRLINELIIINKFYINMQYMCWICVYIDFDFL